MSRNPLLVSGATGLVGGSLCRKLSEEGRAVRALTRRPSGLTGTPPGLEAVGWDGSNFEASLLEGHQAVVHLAGEPIFGGLPTRARRQRMRASRIESTRSLARAIAALPGSARPSVLICASAVGFYGSRGDETLTEDSPGGEGFLAQLCKDWEAAALETPQTRVVCLRIGIVLSRSGGALPMMALPFRLGLGGRLGDGRQWIPWIHLDDLVSLIDRCLDDDGIRGPINATAPNPVQNRELTRCLARVLHRPALFPAPAFAIRGALGPLADELLGSKRVLPHRALERGFQFAYSEIEPALRREWDGA
ncbi:TIGR01777 family oxidoreductase [Myxococcota bacterium]|nr:TIGR01777 family oxidoreductase [Myxococcota bacterium]